MSAAHLIGLSAGLLAAAAICVLMQRPKASASQPIAKAPIGGSILAGVPLTLRLPSLRGIALLVICYSAISTVLYVEQLDIAQRTFAESGERTAFFATSIWR